MKLTIDCTELSAALSTASHALAARSTLTILESVLIKTGDHGISVTCSDGSMTICAQAPAYIEEEGSIALPGRLFQDVVRRLPGGDVSMTTGSSGTNATLKCGISRTTIAGMSGDLFPQMPSIDERNRVTLPQLAFKNMIAKTSFAISTDETHRILTGCLLEVQPGLSRMVALDGYRAAVYQAQVSDDAPTLNAVIPGKLLQEVGKILTDEDDKTVTLIFGETMLKLEMDSAVVYTSLLEGEYINYRQIIPATSATRLTVLDRTQLSQCVERASLLARENRSNIIRCDISADKMVISSNSEMGDNREEIDVETQGNPLAIAFNARYMSDVLKVIDDDQMVMRFNTPVAPCVIQPCEGEAYTYLVLPLRMNA